MGSQKQLIDEIAKQADRQGFDVDFRGGKYVFHHGGKLVGSLNHGASRSKLNNVLSQLRKCGFSFR